MRSTWTIALPIAAVVVAATGWMFSPLGRPAPVEAEAGAPAAAAPVDLSGFRADAWQLPDEPLLGFVKIPAGPFLMGSDPAVDPMAFDNERWGSDHAQVPVDVPEFYIGRYEVTVAQYRAFVEATGHRVAPQTLDAPPDHPVSSVTWPDALAYCRWLGAALTGSPDAPEELAGRLRDGWQVTLPTEAQWEKAARGTDGRVFPWGNEPRQDHANYRGRGTRPVGHVRCPECAFGLLDMSGNVWEWTRSPFEPYPYDPADDHEHLGADALWVMRGGSFADAERNVRAAIRGGADPGARRPFIGFRVVISRS